MKKRRNLGFPGSHSLTTLTDPRKRRPDPGVKYEPSTTPIGYILPLGKLPPPAKRPPPIR